MALPIQPIPPIVPLPLPVIGQQPNFDNLNEGIQHAVQDQGNVPGPATQEQFQYMANQLNLITNQIQQLTVTVNNVSAVMNRLPHMLYNSTATADCPILYPEGVIVVHPMPATKRELSTASGASCNVTLAALGLNVPGGGIHVTAKRQILMDYLGTAMRA